MTYILFHTLKKEKQYPLKHLFELKYIVQSFSRLILLNAIDSVYQYWSVISNWTLLHRLQRTSLSEKFLDAFAREVVVLLVYYILSFEKVVFHQGLVNDRKLVVGNLDAFYADFFVLLPGNGKSFVRAP